VGKRRKEGINAEGAEGAEDAEGKRLGLRLGLGLRLRGGDWVPAEDVKIYRFDH
jgi:hypothetical protein